MGGGTGRAGRRCLRGYRIAVNKSTNPLTLYQNEMVVRSYSGATGRSLRLTPEGMFPIVMKVVNPGWKDVPGGVPPNPLGKRWLDLKCSPECRPQMMIERFRKISSFFLFTRIRNLCMLEIETSHPPMRRFLLRDGGDREKRRERQRFAIGNGGSFHLSRWP
ncbi:L,D-transpeptidase [Polycladomyces sp. WAk]|uniref:L,D-transpeptidase n=1 Tax=Polycladomyces zharkentensis TaxID=2807616 RepID=A0ABS2WH75_9BACL|nr:L,D-transpeptidase [Polycladomyces sp. WAk]